MRVLSSIVGAQSLLVQTREANFAERRSVGPDADRQRSRLICSDLADEAIQILDGYLRPALRFDRTRIRYSNSLKGSSGKTLLLI
jgi:hypothetical protein